MLDSISSRFLGRCWSVRGAVCPRARHGCAMGLDFKTFERTYFWWSNPIARGILRTRLWLFAACRAVRADVSRCKLKECGRCTRTYADKQWNISSIHGEVGGMLQFNHLFNISCWSPCSFRISFRQFHFLTPENFSNGKDIWFGLLKN